MIVRNRVFETRMSEFKSQSLTSYGILARLLFFVSQFPYPKIRIIVLILYRAVVKLNETICQSAENNAWNTVRLSKW